MPTTKSIADASSSSWRDSKPKESARLTKWFPLSARKPMAHFQHGGKRPCVRRYSPLLFVLAPWSALYLFVVVDVSERLFTRYKVRSPHFNKRKRDVYNDGHAQRMHMLLRIAIFAIGCSVRAIKRRGTQGIFADCFVNGGCSACWWCVISAQSCRRGYLAASQRADRNTC